MASRNQFQIFGRPVNLIVGFIVLIILVLGLMRLASFVYSLLAMITPVLLIAAAIIDYKVIVNYVTWIFDMLKKAPPIGVVGILATIIGFPFVSAYLLGKALINKKLIKMTGAPEETVEGEYIRFEEIQKEPIETKKESGQSNG